MKILAPKPVSASRATLACFVQPENANLMGIVHGGFILHQIDSVAAVSAMRHVRGTEIGRAHVWTPVTMLSRMPSSA